MFGFGVLCLHFFFSFCCMHFRGQSYCSRTVHVLFTHCLRTAHALFTGPTTTLFRKKIYIKNGSHDTIHPFKNYFATVFSVFSKISCIQTNLKKIKSNNIEMFMFCKILNLYNYISLLRYSVF